MLYVLQLFGVSNLCRRLIKALGSKFNQSYINLIAVTFLVSASWDSKSSTRLAAAFSISSFSSAISGGLVLRTFIFSSSSARRFSTNANSATETVGVGGGCCTIWLLSMSATSAFVTFLDIERPTRIIVTTPITNATTPPKMWLLLGPLLIPERV